MKKFFARHFRVDIFLFADTLPFVFVRDVTATTASVSWMTIPGNPTYLVFYTGPNGVPQTVVSSSDSADLTGLTPGSAYNVNVRANLPDGMGTTEIGTVTFNTGTNSNTLFDIQLECMSMTEFICD